MRLITKAMALGIAIAVQTSTTSALEEIKGSTFQLLKEVPLNDSGEKGLKTFRGEKSAFGSMFVSPDGAKGAWQSGMFNLAAAQEVAKTTCEVRAQGPCVEIARSVPRGSVGNVAIPKKAQGDFRTATRKTESGRYATFAINGLGGFGWGSNHANLVEARERAVLQCQASSAKARARHDKALRQAFDRAALYDCAIIHTIQKK